MKLNCCSSFNEPRSFFADFEHLKSLDQIILVCIVFGSSTYGYSEKMESLATQMAEI